MHAPHNMRIALAALVTSVMLAACMSDQTSAPPGGTGRTDRESGDCIIGGCSEEVCADQLEFSPCIYRAVNACYQTAQCGRQADGSCGWDATPELTACIASHPS